MVKIIEPGSKKTTCKDCNSLLEYEPKDVFLVNEAVGWAGETFDPHYYIRCPHCSADIPVKISSGLASELIGKWTKKILGPQEI